LCAGRDAGDRHRFYDGERVALEEHAVLERAGFRLVGVAHELVIARRRGDRGPFAPGRERRPAAAQQPRRADLVDHRLWADLQCPGEGSVAAVRPIVIERCRVDHPDPVQQPERGITLLGDRRRRRRPAAALEPPDHARRVHGRDADGRGCLTGRRDERGGSAFAQAQTRAAEPRRHAVGRRRPCRAERPLQVGAQLLRPGQPARDVVAHVGHDGWPWAGWEPGIEGRHAVGLGRRDGESAADVVEPALADPADPSLEGMERR
jgi:hypothetical protein